MGDRAGVRFVSKLDVESGEHSAPILCDHYGGRLFQDKARDWAKNCDHSSDPCDATVEFITWLIKEDDYTTASMYAAVDDKYVDDSDQGTIFVEVD